MLLSDFISVIEENAEDGTLSFASTDDPSFRTFGQAASCEVTDQSTLFVKRVILSLDAIDNPEHRYQTLERNGFIAYLKQLQAKRSPKTHIVVALFNEGGTERRELLRDKMWGRMVYRGGNEFGLSDGSSGLDTSTEAMYWYYPNPNRA